jgi:hypothetical protein
MIMVGYAENHSPDVYRMYNSITDTVILSHDGSDPAPQRL